MKYLQLLVLLVLAGSLVAGCGEKSGEFESNLPADPTFAMQVRLEGTEMLNDIGALPAANGIVAAGVGLRGDPATLQPGMINLNVPGTVVKAFLYWEGQMATNVVGDDQVTINGNPVTGTLLGGPVKIVWDEWVTAFRADVTAYVNTGDNTFMIDGLDFNSRCPDCRNDGAAVLVLYDDGSSEPCDLSVRDGVDFAFVNFESPRDATVPQTFSFTPDPDNVRQGKLIIMAGSVNTEDRPNTICISFDGGPETEYVDLLDSNDGNDWDTLPMMIDIPAGVSTMTVELKSRRADESLYAIDALPASMTWIVAAFCAPPPEMGDEGCTPGYWKNHAGSWAMTGYGPGDDFDATFGVDMWSPDITLCEALNQGGGGDNALGRHAVAALLSASHPYVNYGLAPGAILEAVASGDKYLLQYYNEMYCPIGGPDDNGKCNGRGNNGRGGMER